MKENTWEWFDLKYDLAEIIISKLENYKKEYMTKGQCIPIWINEDELSSDTKVEKLQELWVNEVDKMILAFKQILDYRMQTDENLGYDEELIQSGLDSFAKCFQHFWD